MTYGLIRSYTDFEYSPALIKESINKHGKIIMEGILQKADTVNQNGRIYPLSILRREVDNYQKFIVENRATGELDHPSETVVSLKNVSHIIRAAWMDGNIVMGKVEILNTPSAQILQSLIESKVKLGISSRGVGSTKEQNEYLVVGDDFQLICWDFVSEPSTPGAFMFPKKSVAQENMIVVGQSVEQQVTMKQNSFIDRIKQYRGK